MEQGPQGLRLLEALDAGEGGGQGKAVVAEVVAGGVGIYEKDSVLMASDAVYPGLHPPVCGGRGAVRTRDAAVGGREKEKLREHCAKQNITTAHDLQGTIREFEPEFEEAPTYELVVTVILRDAVELFGEAND